MDQISVFLIGIAVSSLLIILGETIQFFFSFSFRTIRKIESAIKMCFIFAMIFFIAFMALIIGMIIQ